MSTFYSDELKKIGEILDSYADLENDLTILAGFNLRTLNKKLKAGYTIEAPEEKDWAPHLFNCACSDDWAQGIREVYVINPDYKWDDLTNDEKRKIYESQQYLLNKKRR